jgi:chromosome partitioning protein
MKVVAVTAGKGGTGKTTIAAALAVAACQDCGGRLGVAVMDLDPQGSLTDWWNGRGGGDSPSIAQGGRRGLAEIVEALRRAGCDLLVLDCPPAYSGLLREAVAVADLAVIPTGPGSMELAVVPAAVAMAEDAGVPYLVVLNRAHFRSRLAGRAVTHLRDAYGHVAPVIHHRVKIAEAAEGGGTITETAPGSAGAAEVAAVWRRVRAELWGSAGPRAGLAAADGAAA